MKTTINEIAKLAGVAKSTVSRYLNGGHVSAATKEKIKRVVEAENYQPNSFAQSLKAKRTNFIGVIAPTLDSFTTSQALMAIDEELKHQQYTTLIINTSKSIEREIEALLNFSRQKVDGIILLATEITKQHTDIISGLDIPVLIVGQETTCCHCIVYDDYHAGYEIGRKVAGKGHRSVVYLGVPEMDVAVGVTRKQGVLDGLASLGVTDVPTVVASFEFEDGMTRTELILQEHRPSAIICATDTLALGALKTLSTHQQCVPEDVSLAGFGGYHISALIHPSLTTVRFKNAEAGVLAAKTIIRLLDGEPVPERQVCGYTVIEGDSIKKLAEANITIEGAVIK